MKDVFIGHTQPSFFVDTLTAGDTAGDSIINTNTFTLSSANTLIND